MKLLALENWPVWFMCLEMIAMAAASVTLREFRVENRLTIPFVLGGWLLGLLHTMAIHPFSDAGTGGLSASLTCTAIGLLPLVGLYLIGGVGAGVVKLEAGFCAWLGAFYGLWESVLVFLGIFAASFAMCAFICLIWWLTLGRQSQTKRLLLPMAVPLAITSVGYLLWRHW